MSGEFGAQIVRKVEKRIYSKEEINEIIAGLQQANAKAEMSVAALPKQISTNRPLLRLRVMDVIERQDYRKLIGLLDDPTVEYDKSCDIKNYGGAIAGRVDKEARTLTVFPIKFDDYDTNVKECEAKFGSIRDLADGKTEIVYRAGQRVEIRTEESVAEIEMFSLVTIGISVSFYCLPADKQDAGKGAVRGISTKAKQIVPLKRTTRKQVWDLFWSDPQYMMLPLRTPQQLFESNNYRYTRVLDDKDFAKKVTSEETLFLPVANEAKAIEFFGPDGPGVSIGFKWEDDAFVFARRDNKQMKRRAMGLAMVKEWLSFDELDRYRTTADIKAIETFQCKFTIWDGIEATKIEGVDTWQAFAERIFETMPMILKTQVLLYPTAAHQFNGGAHTNPREHFLELKVTDVYCDFVEYLRTDGLPVSYEAVRTWVKQADPRLASFTTPHPDLKQQKIQVTRNQLDSKDTTYVLLNEWNADGLKNFIDSPAAASTHDYYVLLPAEMSEQAMTRAALIRQYAADKGPQYKGPLADPMLWKGWDNNNVDKYVQAMGGNQVLRLPDDHPLLLNVVGSIAQPLMLVYAVDREARADVVRKAFEEPLMIAAPPPKRQLAIDAVGAGDQKKRIVAIGEDDGGIDDAALADMDLQQSPVAIETADKEEDEDSATGSDKETE